MSGASSRPKKVFVLIVPLWSQINPLTGIIRELTLRDPNIQVTFYATEKFKSVIERTGAAYKPYPDFTVDLENKSSGSPNPNVSPMLKILVNLMSFSDQVLPKLIRDCEQERPDLIVYDLISLHAAYLLNALQTRYKNKQSRVKAPQAVKISQAFARLDGVFPTREELEFSKRFRTKWFWLYVFVIFFVQLRLSWKYGLTVYNPFRLLAQKPHDIIEIVAVFPELQPKRQLFDNTYKFVGNCICENMRRVEIRDEKLKHLMSLFPPVNPVEYKNPNRVLKLIYVSLGTVFFSRTSNNLLAFEKILDAIKIFEFNESYSGIRLTHLRVVVSLGTVAYKQFMYRLSKGWYELPKNVLLVPSAPQIELLRRASLFITHAGMNSASEAIHYAVPVICVPMQLDQPIVAKRLTRDLRIGIYFDHAELFPGEIYEAIDEILREGKYLRRCIELAKISRQYNGSVNSAEIISNLLNNSSLSDEKK
jgi:UDP:flavonoid glycosyltransferase YjiC (YdhE family)